MRFSKSRIETFDKCKLQFKLKYVDEIDIPQAVNDDTNFGSLIHKAFEIYNPETKNLKEVVALVRQYPLDQQSYKDAIEPTLRNMMKFYEQFPHPDAKNEFEIQYKSDDMWIYGIVDRMEEANGKVTITDYKSSKTPANYRHKFQMKLYVLIMTKTTDYAAEDIRFRMYYPRPDKMEYFQYSSAEIAEFEQELRTKIELIETTTKFPETIGFHCKWCAFKGTPHCPKQLFR